MMTRPLATFNLWLMLGAGVWILAWLLPEKSEPWRAFYSEWLAASAFIPLSIWVLFKTKTRLQLPLPALLIAALAVVPLAQGIAGQVLFVGDWLLAIFYLLATAATITVGWHWRTMAPSSVSIGLPVTVLIAALASVTLALMQWLKLDSLGVLLLALLPQARPTGNIGQANHLSTLMMWGVLAIWWLFESRRSSAATSIATTMVLLLGVAVSQSRTGWLHVAILVLAALLLRRRFGLRVTPLAVTTLLGLFVALVVSWDSLNHALSQSAPLSLAQQASSGRRLQIWEIFYLAAGQSPWLGYGWLQSGLAQQAVVEQTPALHVVLGSAHNFFLDLLLWQGLPLTLLFLVGSAFGFWRLAAQAHSTEMLLCGLAVTLIAVHALLEYPLSYSYFLLPAGLIVGVLCAQIPDSAQLRMSRGTAVAVAAALVCSLVWLLIEYVAVQSKLVTLRYQTAKVLQKDHVAQGEPRPIYLLTQLDALMTIISMPLHPLPGQALDSVQLGKVRQVVQRFPSAGNQYRLATQLAHAGQFNEAATVMNQLCAIHTAERCVGALAAWQQQAATYPQLANVVLPSTQE